MSILSMMPVVCLGLFAPTASILARRLDVETALLGSLIMLAFDTVLRSLGYWPLFLGTVVIGAAISVLGVLCPVVIKQLFRCQVGPMMGVYTTAIGL